MVRTGVSRSRSRSRSCSRALSLCRSLSLPLMRLSDCLLADLCPVFSGGMYAVDAWEERVAAKSAPTVTTQTCGNMNMNMNVSLSLSLNLNSNLNMNINTNMKGKLLDTYIHTYTCTYLCLPTCMYVPTTHRNVPKTLRRSVLNSRRERAN